MGEYQLGAFLYFHTDGYPPTKLIHLDTLYVAVNRVCQFEAIYTVKDLFWHVARMRSAPLAQASGEGDNGGDYIQFSLEENQLYLTFTFPFLSMHISLPLTTL